MGKKKKKKFNSKDVPSIENKKELKKEDAAGPAQAKGIVPDMADLSANDVLTDGGHDVKEAEIERVRMAGGAAGDNLIDIAGEENEAGVERPITEKERNRRVDTYIEFILIFILGVLIGVALKTEAEKRFTIGFDDYKMKIVRQDYDINKIQTDVTKKSMEDARSQGDAGASAGSDMPDGNAQGGDGVSAGDNGNSDVQQ